MEDESLAEHRTTPAPVPAHFETLNTVHPCSEIGIRFPGLKNIDKPVVWVFPELVVCLDCGTAEFAVPEAELGNLQKAMPPPQDNQN